MKFSKRGECAMRTHIVLAVRFQVSTESLSEGMNPAVGIATKRPAEVPDSR